MFRQQNIELTRPSIIFYVKNYRIHHRAFDPVKDKASSAFLIHVPRKPEYVVEGLFPWLRKQIRIWKDQTNKKCIHLTQDIYNKIKFAYENTTIVATATSPWLALNLKFTANAYAANTNRVKKKAAWLTTWTKASKRVFLNNLPSVRFDDD